MKVTPRSGNCRGRGRTGLEFDMANATCMIDGCERPSKTRGMCGMHTERVRKYGDPNNRGAVIRGDDVARFWQKVDKRGPADCWRWTGTQVQGYGQFKVKGTRVPAHRYAYELVVGPIPEGLELDHVRARGCEHTDCVNPAHLEPVTGVENVMRGDGYAAINARKTRCIRGHRFDKVLTENGRTRRRCSTCHRMKTAESQRRRRLASRVA